VDKRNSLMSDPQQVGGAITFAQRYALQLALGIVTAGDDRDGQGPEPKTNLERLALQPRPAQPEAIDIEEAKPAQPEQQQEPKQAQQPQQPDSAVAELWRLLKPVRGVARNWNQAMEWMRAQGLVGDDVNDIKQLSAKQLASIVSALKNNQPTSTEL
jgi:hypothetical protein